jgi:hypothetical protein
MAAVLLVFSVPAVQCQTLSKIFRGSAPFAHAGLVQIVVEMHAYPSFRTCFNGRQNLGLCDLTAGGQAKRPLRYLLSPTSLRLIQDAVLWLQEP